MGRKPYMIGPGNLEAQWQEFLGTRKSCTDMPTAFASTSTNVTARVLANKARKLA